MKLFRLFAMQLLLAAVLVHLGACDDGTSGDDADVEEEEDMTSDGADVQPDEVDDTTDVSEEDPAGEPVEDVTEEDAGEDPAEDPVEEDAVEDPVEEDAMEEDVVEEEVEEDVVTDTVEDAVDVGEEEEAVVPPTGDTCDDAIPLELPVDTAGDSTGLADDYDPECDGLIGADGEDIVYSFTLGQNMAADIMVTPETDWDVVLYVVTECTELACVVADDTYVSGHYERVQFANFGEAAAYYLIVDGYADGDSGPFTLEITTEEIPNETQDCALTGTPIEEEPNNGFGTATDLGVAETWTDDTVEVYGTIDTPPATTLLPDEAMDVDVYSFDVTAGDLIIVDVAPDTDSLLDPTIAILVDYGEYGFGTLSRNDDTDTPPNSHAEYLFIEDGTYYIYVAHALALPIGGLCYGYHMTVEVADPEPIALDLQDFPSAGETSAFPYGGESFYSFVIPAGEYHMADVHVVRALRDLNPWIRVFSTEDWDLKAVGPLWMAPDLPLTAGTYIVAVSDRNFRGGEDFEASAQILTVEASVAGETETNDVFGDADELPGMPGGFLASLDSATDTADWFSFTAAADAHISLQTFSDGDGADTTIDVYESDGSTLIARNDDVDPEGCLAGEPEACLSRLDRVVVTSGNTYYIRVWTQWGWSGDYILAAWDRCRPDPAMDPAETGNSLWINEVMPNPAGSDAQNEYAEIVHDNTGGALDITGYYVRDLMGPRHLFECDTLYPVRPGGPTGRAAMVYAGDAHNTPGDDPLVDVANFTGSGLSFNNAGGDEVILVAPDGTEVDRLSYTSETEDVSWQRCGDAPDGEVMLHNECFPGNDNSPGQKQNLTDFNP